MDVLVQDMLLNATCQATPSSSSGPPRRPHTACVCARPVLHPVEASSDDDESDGGSLDEGLSEELELRSRPGTAIAAAPQRPQLTLRPYTAPGMAAQEQSLQPAGKPLLPVRAPRKSLELPREMQLLLGGDVFGQALVASSQRASNDIMEVQPPSPVKAADPKTPNAKERDAVAKAAAKKLPRQCLFLGFGTGGYHQSPVTQPSRKLPGRGGGPKAALAPSGYARMRSHISWAHHLPIPVAAASASANTSSTSVVADAITDAAAAADALKPLDVPPAAGMHAVPPALLVRSEAANSITSEVALDGQAPAVAPPSAEPPKRKRGPKYSVAPGGSRPKNAQQQQPPLMQVPPSEFMTLEFRTEPRAVPGTRKPGSREARGNALRFRPKGRTSESKWAAERDVLTMS